MISALKAFTDRFLGRGEATITVPSFDGALKPNQILEGAETVIALLDAAPIYLARTRNIAHLDVTIVCEAPRIGPHRDAMRARIAAIAGIDADRVAIKATTSEKLGFTGRGEGIVAMATATVRLPWSGS